MRLTILVVSGLTMFGFRNHNKAEFEFKNSARFRQAKLKHQLHFLASPYLSNGVEGGMGDYAQPGVLHVHVSIIKSLASDGRAQG
jgi:hypothetical protein